MNGCKILTAHCVILPGNGDFLKPQAVLLPHKKSPFTGSWCTGLAATFAADLLTICVSPSTNN